MCADCARGVTIVAKELLSKYSGLNVDTTTLERPDRPLEDTQTKTTTRSNWWDETDEPLPELEDSAVNELKKLDHEIAEMLDLQDNLGLLLLVDL